MLFVVTQTPTALHQEHIHCLRLIGRPDVAEGSFTNFTWQAGKNGEYGMLQADDRPRILRTKVLYLFAGTVTSRFQDRDQSARTHLQTAS